MSERWEKIVGWVLFCGIAMSLALAACGSVATLAPLPPDAKVLAFGDSLTFGTGADLEQSYPAVLQPLIGHEVINAGVPGEVTDQGRKRLPDLLDIYRPRLLILCHGTNDLLLNLDTDTVADNIRAMIRQAEARGIAVLLVAAPRFRLGVAPAMFYPTIAAEFGVPLLSGAISQVLSDPALRSDPVHPNGKGYRIIAEAVAAKLKQAGAI
jgi:lysophospholipase L1-like esterase